MLSTLNEYRVLVIVLAFILTIIVIYYPEIYRGLIKLISYGRRSLKTLSSGNEVGKVMDYDELEKLIESAGYSYDSEQDIFYSNMDAWQRKVGYCRLYDELAAPMGMIIDCEPIYFEYDGRKWLIEFWKGQYDLTTGCEIGIYTATGPDIDIQGVFNGTFYNCASNSERLKMSLILRKNGKILLKRKGKHWWLTGFKLGEFSKPSELIIDLNITLKNETMRDAFLKGLKKAGYLEDEIIVNRNTVGLKYSNTRTAQPFSRTTKTDWIIQRKNKVLCDNYQDITKSYDNFPDKINAIHEQAPDIYEKIINIGKNKNLFKIYEKIKKYLD